MKKGKAKKAIEFSDKSILVFVSLIIVILLVSLLAQWQLFDKFNISSTSKEKTETGSVSTQVSLQIVEPPVSSIDSSNDKSVSEGVSKK